jgi:hypothetical protein
MTHDMRHMGFLKQVTDEDIKCLRQKEETYQGSWKKRGGVGAFMMCARKWDRLEVMMDDNYNIFDGILGDSSGADGSVLAEVRDLRRYLLLIEAEMISRWDVLANVETMSESERVKLATMRMSDILGPGTPEDGGHHEQDGPKILERLDDGLQTADIEPHQRSLYMSMPHGGRNYNIVNRNKVDPTMWEHLPRLKNELNNKEYEETQPEYQGLFTWNDGGSKWIMQERYRPHWGNK